MMLRRLAIAVSTVAVLAAVFLMVSHREEKAGNKDAKDETARGKRQPHLWTATTASEQAPPHECAPLSAGGFSCGACRDDSSCPPGQYCSVDLESGRTQCRGSDCAKNDDCPRPLLCRVVTRTSRGEPVRGCVAEGIRHAGAPCDSDNAGDPSVSCIGLLVCVHGGCAPACVENEFPERNACVGEVPCVKTDNGWGCVPSCKYEPKNSCGGGKVCEYLSVEDPTALCIHRVGSNCLGSKGGCPSDQECIVETDARAERTTFACAMKCDPAKPACPAGAVCVPGKKNGHCRPSCSGTQEHACADGQRCRKGGAAGELSYCSAA
jgi:hypothetical protein